MTNSSAAFLRQVPQECPYTIECAYSDNGTEYKGTSDHSFMALCKAQGMGQKFTRVKRPKTNGKAECVIKTLMEMWHKKNIFDHYCPVKHIQAPDPPDSEAIRPHFSPVDH